MPICHRKLECWDTFWCLVLRLLHLIFWCPSLTLLYTTVSVTGKIHAQWFWHKKQTTRYIQQFSWAGLTTTHLIFAAVWCVTYVTTLIAYSITASQPRYTISTLSSIHWQWLFCYNQSINFVWTSNLCRACIICSLHSTSWLLDYCVFKTLSLKG